MYEKVNITENHLKILELFTRGYDQAYYIREVQKLISVSPRTAQLILEDLEKKAVLESKTKGKIKSYTLRKNSVAREFMILTEVYKKIVFQQKSLLREIIEKISPHIDGIAVIFGSYAKGIEKKESDIDVFIAGKGEGKEIEKIGKMYNQEIQVKCYPLGIFKKNIKLKNAEKKFLTKTCFL